MGDLNFYVYIFIIFFLKLVVTFRLWVTKVKEDNHPNV